MYRRVLASMRPGDFSPGNIVARCIFLVKWSERFNEAGGFLPRKHGCSSRDSQVSGLSFNEAGGFLPRKRLPNRWENTRSTCFNEAGGFLPRKRRNETNAPAASFSLQ